MQTLYTPLVKSSRTFLARVFLHVFNLQIIFWDCYKNLTYCNVISCMHFIHFFLFQCCSVTLQWALRATEVSNIGFITVHGLNEGHIAPYTDSYLTPDTEIIHNLIGLTCIHNYGLERACSESIANALEFVRPYAGARGCVVADWRCRGRLGRWRRSSFILEAALPLAIGLRQLRTAVAVPWTIRHV